MPRSFGRKRNVSVTFSPDEDVINPDGTTEPTDVSDSPTDDGDTVSPLIPLDIKQGVTIIDDSDINDALNTLEIVDVKPLRQLRASKPIRGLSNYYNSGTLNPKKIQQYATMERKDDIKYAKVMTVSSRHDRWRVVFDNGIHKEYLFKDYDSNPVKGKEKAEAFFRNAHAEAF